MERLIRWFVNNGVAANLLMAFIIIAGALTIPLLKMEVFPEIEIEIINVTAVYPGASPSDVEDAICIRIEERLQGLDGIKQISSNASENIGSVNVEILPGQDASQMLDRIKAQVDAIDTFPEDVERPTVRQFVGSNPVLTIAVDGDVGETALNDVTEVIKDEIDGLAEVTYTSIVAKKEREIAIEISENTLRKYNLTFGQVAQAIQNWSINMPSGSIENKDGEILIRSKSQGYTADDFAAIPIIIAPSGAIVHLGVLSTIRDGFSETYELDILFNSQTSNLITVFRVGDQNAIDISSAVKNYITVKQKNLPPGVNITAWDDEARLLRGRIDTMTKNAQYGLMLVVLVLALFLKPRLAFWVSLGIPISFMGGFWLMPLMDLSINMLSLFTFILVLGIVVDDAIVVGENVALFRERGMSPKEAAVKGTVQVATPVFFAVLTTMATFSPMLAVEGEIGSIWRIFPLITISVLFWSLFESLTLLPAHLAHSGEEKTKQPWLRSFSDQWEQFQSSLVGGLFNVLEKI